MIQNKDYKQLIIARKDLDMTPGKLAAQVSHASMAFLTNMIKKKAHPVICKNCNKIYCKDNVGRPILYRHPQLFELAKKGYEKGKDFIWVKQSAKDGIIEISQEEAQCGYEALIDFDEYLYNNWIMGSFTKVVCGARNLHQLMRVTEVAANLGLKEGIDYFIIKDNCLTELEPEEVDENGIGKTTTCIGFIPLPADIAAQLSKKYQLY